MLAYSFAVLQEERYSTGRVRESNTVLELLTEILLKGVSSQLSRGLDKCYEHKMDTLVAIRGSINVTESIKGFTIEQKKKVVCDFDEYTTNSYLNQILKATLTSISVNEEAKFSLRFRVKKALQYFSEVADIDYRKIDWSRLNYTRSNCSYRMLMNICNIVLNPFNGNPDSEYITNEKFEVMFSRFVLDWLISHKEAQQVNLDDGEGEMAKEGLLGVTSFEVQKEKLEPMAISNNADSMKYTSAPIKVIRVKSSQGDNLFGVKYLGSKAGFFRNSNGAGMGSTGVELGSTRVPLGTARVPRVPRSLEKEVQEVAEEFMTNVSRMAKASMKGECSTDRQPKQNYFMQSRNNPPVLVIGHSGNTENEVYSVRTSLGTVSVRYLNFSRNWNGIERELQKIFKVNSRM